MELEGKTAVITGGTGHLGRAVVARFLREGAGVLVSWRSEEEWRELEASIDDEFSDRLVGLRADVTDEEQVEGLMRTAVDRFGGLDALLNLVGGFAFGRNVWETDLATWDRMMDLNLKSAFLCSKHALPVMREAGRGAIVYVSSKACEDLQPGAAAYAVSKGALITLMRALREEVKDTGIRVNTIMPGIIDTPVTRRLMPKADTGKWVGPDEVADALVALCSERCGVASGSVIRLFGGL